MGLSNEERFRKFVYGVQDWRRLADEFATLLERERYGRVSGYSEETQGGVARSWVRRIDRLLGKLIVGKTNRNSGYWLMGEGEGSFRSIVADHYLDLYDADSDMYAKLPKPEHESMGWWADNADMELAAQRLQWSGEKHEGLDHLGRWWDLYAYFSALNYAINRYDDELFGVINDDFTDLVGEMVNRRFEVCFGQRDVTEAARKETLMLLKHDAFHVLLQKESKSAKGSYLTKKFDGYALWDKVARMTRKDLKQLFDKDREDKDKWRRDYDDKERAKKKDKLDGLTGLGGEPPVAPPPAAKKRRK